MRYAGRVEPRNDDDRVSLQGLDPREALKALLAVDPVSAPDEKGDQPKEPAGDAHQDKDD